MPTLYWKSTCKTSRRVRDALCDAHPDLGCRNYANVRLTSDEVTRLVLAAGGVANVLKTAHAIAKAQRWDDAPPSVETFIAAAAKDANLLRRPILLAGRQAVVGDHVLEMLALIGPIPPHRSLGASSVLAPPSRVASAADAAMTRPK